MKKLLLLPLLFLLLNVNAQRVVYEIDTNLTITQGFQLNKSIVVIGTQHLKGIVPELAFDLESYSDTSAIIEGVKPFVLKSAKTNKPFNAYDFSPLDSVQRASFCLPDYGFISVYKSIISKELEISEEVINIYTCYTCE